MRSTPKIHESILLRGEFLGECGRSYQKRFIFRVCDISVNLLRHRGPRESTTEQPMLILDKILSEHDTLHTSRGKGMKRYY